MVLSLVEMRPGMRGGGGRWRKCELIGSQGTQQSTVGEAIKRNANFYT